MLLGAVMLQKNGSLQANDPREICVGNLFFVGNLLLFGCLDPCCVAGNHV